MRAGEMTGMSSTERSALAPESLIVSMQRASYPSSCAVQPASNMAMSAMARSCQES